MSEPVESREEEFVGDAITETGKARETKKTIQVVDGIIKKDTLTRISFASCGHPLHSSQDIGGKCAEKDCSNIACIRCFKICERCGKATCRRHAKLWKGLAFCGSCHWKVLLIGWRGDGFQGT